MGSVTSEILLPSANEATLLLLRSQALGKEE